MADFNDFGLILQDFERPFRRNQLVLALQFSFKGEMQRQNMLISSERPFKILQNETKIIKICQVILKIFNVKDRDWAILQEKTTEKP